MAILLYHDTQTDGKTSMAEEIIGGERTPERRYEQKGHFLEVNPPANARAHDLDQLQQLGFRLATPSEQNMYTKQQKRSGDLTEVTQQVAHSVTTEQVEQHNSEQTEPLDPDHTKKKR